MAGEPETPNPKPHSPPAHPVERLTSALMGAEAGAPEAKRPAARSVEQLASAPMAAEPKEPDLRWESLSLELFSMVALRLRSFAEHARASAVCRNWRRIATLSRRPAPMLMLPATAAGFVADYVKLSPGKISPDIWLWRPTKGPTETLPRTASPEFLLVFGKGRYFISDDDESYPHDARTARFCGSFSGGWIALALDQGRGYFLLNIYTSERKALPDLFHCPAPAADCVLGFSSFILSAAPTPEGNFMVAAMTWGAASVAFWRPGLDCWWPPMPLQDNDELSGWKSMQPCGNVEDALFFNGCFYVLNSEDELVMYMEPGGGGNNVNSGSFGATSGPFKMTMVRYEIRSDTRVTNRDVVSRYLVESDGKLLMVRELGDPGLEKYEVFCLEEAASCTRVENRIAWWRKCDISGWALFLGRGHSKSMQTGSASSIFVHRTCENGGWIY